MLSGATEWVTDLIDALGYLGVALLVALENLFPPIPSEVVLPFAGFVASDGDASLPGMIVAATLGSLGGAYLLYGLAAWIGRARLHALVSRHGRWARLTEVDIEKAEHWFAARGEVAVLVGRCVPLIRSLVSVPAGFARMPLRTFTLYTVLGSAVWNTVLVTAGYALRHRWEEVEPIVDGAQLVVVGLIVAGAGWYLWTRFLSPEARRLAAEFEGEGRQEHHPTP